MNINEDVFKIIIIVLASILLGIIAAYLIIRKFTNKKELQAIKKLRQGTSAKSFSLEILYQKLYIVYFRMPFLKRYLIKIRRRLEILNVQDEYLTRKQTAKLLTNMLLLIVPVTLAIVILNRNNLLMLFILLISELFFVDLYIDSRVDKLDNKLLKQQVTFFTDIRHAYHEVNMVDEAIYQTITESDEKEIARQGEKIYDILNSDNPETELEKYYDTAPNSYLKEFAGISYLTKEYGDRKDKNGASVYLNNLNHITGEMQLELLKRDKLDYTFQSLSVISVLPMLFLEPIRTWAVNQFGLQAIESFYNGKPGMIIQLLILVITLVCYTLIRKLKDNGSNNIRIRNEENPWQNKIYNIPFLKQFVDLFIPKRGTKSYRKVTEKLKDAAAKIKIEWFYVNRITFVVFTFIISVGLCFALHRISVNYVYNAPTTDYDVIGTLSERDKIKAEELTKLDNKIIKSFKNRNNFSTSQIKELLKQTDYYKNSTDERLEAAAKRITSKIKTVKEENMKWYEILICVLIACASYMAPVALLSFQIKMRELEKENEVMQFQTIILMLMNIERINVETILEWLERYSNIFKEPINKCLNNYESGAYEALETLKEDVSYKELIRIIEGLQASVEKISIREAFDELESERDYYKEKRKEANDRLISRKGLIGRMVRIYTYGITFCRILNYSINIRRNKEFIGFVFIIINDEVIDVVILNIKVGDSNRKHFKSFNINRKHNNFYNNYFACVIRICWYI